jgi:hypothetical protein
VRAKKVKAEVQAEVKNMGDVPLSTLTVSQPDYDFADVSYGIRQDSSR